MQCWECGGRSGASTPSGAPTGRSASERLCGCRLLHLWVPGLWLEVRQRISLSRRRDTQSELRWKGVRHRQSSSGALAEGSEAAASPAVGLVLTAASAKVVSELYVESLGRRGRMGAEPELGRGFSFLPGVLASGTGDPGPWLGPSPPCLLTPGAPTLLLPPAGGSLSRMLSVAGIQRASCSGFCSMAV